MQWLAAFHRALNNVAARCFVVQHNSGGHNRQPVLDFHFLDFSQDPNGPSTRRASHTEAIHKTTTLPLTAATRQNSPNAGS